MVTDGLLPEHTVLHPPPKGNVMVQAPGARWGQAPRLHPRVMWNYVCGSPMETTKCYPLWFLAWAPSPATSLAFEDAPQVVSFWYFSGLHGPSAWLFGSSFLFRQGGLNHIFISLGSGVSYVDDIIPILSLFPQLPAAYPLGNSGSFEKEKNNCFWHWTIVCSATVGEQVLTCLNLTFKNILVSVFY